MGWNFSLTNIPDYQLSVYETDTFLTEEGAKHSRTLDSGTLIVANSGATLGVAKILQIKCCANDGIAAIKEQKLGDKKFICYYINTLTKSLRDTIATGNGQPNLNTTLIRGISVPFPQIPEQRAIATALGDMDALLDGLDRLIAKKRAIKQAAMQQLLTGQTRLPEFSGEWKIKRLENILTIRHGKSQKGVEVSNGPYPILATGGQIGTASQAIYEKPSVLIGRKGTINQPQYMDKPFWSVDTLFYSEIKNGNIAKFFYYRFCLIDWMQYNEASGVPSLNTKTIEGIELACPIPEEQTAIVAVLSDMDAEITALETRRAKTRSLKQAMMQELLTGRTRLVKPGEKPIEEAVAQTKGRKPNIYFLRSVLAAEIIDQLHDHSTFGHVKFEKMMFLAEHLCEVDTGSTYYRKAAGPYDNRALRSIDSQLQKQQWFEARKENGRFRYVPMAKRGGHRPYFDRHFSGIGEILEKILTTFKTATTEQCEIVATLLAAWSDLLREKESVSDEMIVHEVLNNWHESKQRIPEDSWLNALGWMRKKGFVPKGVA
ncbi:MAG: restriction endonuclease subunit S [Azoarcus sp.]|jgi:restriction endonuclease S subunit|nr:restriction endonuclease subunit S [Azoarcus sp.]